MAELIGSGVPVDVGGEALGITPLHLALDGGHSEVAALLIQNGADQRFRGSIDGLLPLNKAAAKGMARVVKMLLERGAFCPGDVRDGGSPLFDAIDGGDVGIVRMLLRAGVDPNSRHRAYKHCGTPLVYALLRERFDVAAVLLDSGADVSVPGCADSPLELAAAADRLDLVEAILQKGVPVEELGRALGAAAEAGAVRAIGVLLAQGAPVDAGGPEGLRTPLLRAAAGGSLSAVTLLLSRGADPSFVCDNGNALHAAAEGGSGDLARLLLRMGSIDVSGRNRIGDTPLHVAAVRCSVETARVLLAAGSDPDARNIFGETPMHAIARFWHNGDREALDMCRLLVAAGADPAAIAGTGDTPLLQAAAHGWCRVARFLIDRGVDCSAHDRYGASALHLAAGVSEDTVRLLLRHGLSVRATAADRRTPLHYAAAADRPAIVACLLDHGADVNATDDEGETPLHAAMKDGGLETVRLLLSHGARRDAQTASGATPLEIAEWWHRSEVAAVLRDSAAGHRQ